ncbi:MAG: hypothetical protein HXX08_25045 [Chloroflexi bacterium]|uniref:TIR domain-containing protein n=1 Tax=Candidatus Chlorohelix allophototropha TaxID=3003348 RepID=A0A8T7MAC5_9CHLR|nr:hypothetical protein [Chloroflexota bacterium]WJW70447.1 hypothetical protein OZ401_005083 [Chloroflexota bacterium L227-S17]
MTVTVMTVVICAPKDQPIRNELLKFFSPLIRQGDITVWPELQLFSDMAQVKKLILEKAHQSDLLVLIVSPEFLDDEFFYTELIKGLVARDTLRIIPVILKDCLWWETPLEKLSVLPKEVNQKKGELLPDYLGRRTKRERVLCQVGLDLLEVIKEMRVRKATQPPSLPTATVTETRHLDTALPSEVEMGERVHILAMLRTKNSQGLREYLSDIEKQEAFDLKPEQVVTPGKIEIKYPKDLAGQVLPVELLVKVSSIDFELEKSVERVTLTLQKDSIPCIFPMKPLKLGTLEVKLKVSSLDEALFFETTLTTECVAKAASTSYTIKAVTKRNTRPDIVLQARPGKLAQYVANREAGQLDLIQKLDRAYNLASELDLQLAHAHNFDVTREVSLARKFASQLAYELNHLRELNYAELFGRGGISTFFTRASDRASTRASLLNSIRELASQLDPTITSELIIARELANQLVSSIDGLPFQNTPESVITAESKRFLIIAVAIFIVFLIIALSVNYLGARDAMPTSIPYGTPNFTVQLSPSPASSLTPAYLP